MRNLTDEMIRLLADRGGIMGINFCPAFLSASQSMQKGGGQSFVRDMVSQMKYIRNVGGIECIGLGSDFDGITGELEVDSPAAFWKIADEMHRQDLRLLRSSRCFTGTPDAFLQKFYIKL